MIEIDDTEELENIVAIKKASYDIISFPFKDLPVTYKGFVFAKWLNSLRYGNLLYYKVDSKEYYKNYQLYLEMLMAKPDALIRLAVLTDDHDVALGFSAGREDILDYIYVCPPYRKIGIAKALTDMQAYRGFTHITKTATNIWLGKKKYQDHLKFNPFI